MRSVPITRGGVALVDDEDFEKVSALKWQLGSHGYAQHFLKRQWPKKPAILMHRWLTNAPRVMKVDHINGDRLDNRKSNLRLCTATGNSRNAKPSKNNKCGLKGVSRLRNKWRARIMVNRKEIRLGTFEKPEEAAEAYDRAAIKYFGEFAWLNKNNKEKK